MFINTGSGTTPISFPVLIISLIFLHTPPLLGMPENSTNKLRMAFLNSKLSKPI